jgi:uncharacterized 2Fe-2S/4Fe-4S cluster protein (DUF4445 family)
MNKKKKYHVKFLPSDKSIEVPPGYNLRQAILDCGLEIDSSCGGVGTCGRCAVRIVSGEIDTKKTKFIKEKLANKGFVLSCLSEIKSDLVVEIFYRQQRKAKIAEGRFKPDKLSEYAEVKQSELSSIEVNPWIIKENIEVEKPSLSYGTSDLYRLKKTVAARTGIKNLYIPINLIRKIPYEIRKKEWKITVIMDRENGSLIDFHSGYLGKEIYGIALDIGTTSLVMYLVDLLNGEVISTQSGYNPQIRYGEDVINRIVYSGKQSGLSKLREVLIDYLNSMIAKMLEETKIKARDVVSLMIAGNSTMMHLFYGVPPKYIREEPYVTVANKFSESTAAEVGIKHLSNAHVYSIPGVASYLGGDITSGILASGMYEEKSLALFLDLGTNGELVVGNSEWMMGCSCSAGPAFEGGGVKCGIRAAEGAIEKVSIDQETYRCSIDVIGGTKPEGICGSGLIDIIGEMYTRGVVDRKGKFNTDIGNRYLVCNEEGCRYIIVPAAESATGKSIFISEVDIDNLIRAKSAVYAGIRTLLEEVGLGTGDLEKVYIAGGLGKHLNVRNAVMIGMLPDIDIGKYNFLGNTSVTGAYLSIMSGKKYNQGIKISEHITYIELSVSMKFMDRYVAGLFLPYTDMKDFPTVEEYLYN